ncbi:MAG: AMP-binding protein [Pseudomonadota bacterium]
MTYRALQRDTDRFANWLTAAGVRKGDRVAVVMPRLPETVIILLGAWKAGAVYVPIFAGFGADAIRHRVNDSGARVVCTHASLRDKIAGPFPHAPLILTVGAQAAPGDIVYDAALAAQPDRAPPCPARAATPAALIYTSGSTGPSKGVAIATNLVAAIWPAMRYGGPTCSPTTGSGRPAIRAGATGWCATRSHSRWACR